MFIYNFKLGFSMILNDISLGIRIISLYSKRIFLLLKNINFSNIYILFTLGKRNINFAR